MHSRFRHAVAVVCVALVIPARAEADEFWPELDVWAKLTESMRLLVTSAATRDRDSGDRIVADYGAHLDYRMSDSISWRGGYVYSKNLAQAPGEQDSIENRLSFDFSYRWRLAHDFLLTDRTRLDLRDIGGTDSYRIRNRLRLERAFEVSRRTLTPYAELEAYYDDRYSGISRVFLQAGTVVAISKTFTADFYLGRQHDSEPKEKYTNGLGITLSVYF